MLINISEILSNPSVEKNYTVNMDMDLITFKQRQFPVSKKEEFSFRMQRNEKTIVMQCDTEVTVLVPCDRCLDDVPLTFPVHIDEKIDVAKLTEGMKDEDELLFIEGCMLDVDKLISDEVVVALPTKVLCGDDCKGLCSVCGTNLNHDTCQCDRQVLDPRMAAIKDIFQNFHQ